MSLINKRGKVFRYFLNQVDSVVSDNNKNYRPSRLKRRKIIRDSVFNFNSYHEHEINIIDSPILQRLKYIHQTSLAFQVYPSSHHNRFEHSLSCVGIVDIVSQALNKKKKNQISKTTAFELRLAALLHDCGHGPFSHASELIYGDMKEFDKLRTENPKLLKQFIVNGAGEIFSFLIILTPTFQKMWKQIIALYKNDQQYYADLKKIDLERVALMILGKRHIFTNQKEYFLDQIINGPYDMDKIDYIHRDGYFTGLGISLDLARLLETLDTYKDSKSKKTFLTVDISGATSIEQLLFSKMLLTAVVYHHQKVRSAFLSIKSLFEFIKDNKLKINNLDFSKPFHFLRLTDNDILRNGHKSRKLQKFINKIINRELPKVALVLAPFTLTGEESEESLFEKAKDKEYIEYLRKKIARLSDVPYYDVHIDIPRRPKFDTEAKEGRIKISKTKVVTLDDIFPTSGWVKAYSQNRYKAFVFAMNSKCEKVAKVAAKIFKDDDNILLNKDAFVLAKHEDDFLNSNNRLFN